MGQTSYRCPVVAARRAFIGNEIGKLGGSQKAVESLYEVKWFIIKAWIDGTAQAAVESLITDHLHKAEINSRTYDDISEQIGTMVRRIRNLDRAFREAGN